MLLKIKLNAKLLLTTFALATTILLPLSSQAIEFKTNAKQALLIDYNSKTVLFDKDASKRMFPSSMTKVITMYIVFDQLKNGILTMDDEFKVSEKAWKTVGSRMFLKAGDRVKLSDLIQGVIVQSGNDACVVLAEGIAGSEAAFAEEMTKTAKRIGMKNTIFQNASGLPAENHHTTAEDLAIAAERIIEDFPEYYKYYSQKEYTYAGIKQTNRNLLLNRRDLGIDGLKTGYTDKGGYGMIATGQKNGRRLVAVVNGLGSERARISAAEELIRYGYNNFKAQKLFNKSQIVGSVNVWGGKQDSVNLITSEDINIVLSKREYNFKKFTTELAFKEPWTAPIKQGVHMANLVVKNSEGEVIAVKPLYSANSIEEAGFFSKLLQKTMLLFK